MYELYSPQVLSPIAPLHFPFPNKVVLLALGTRDYVIFNYVLSQIIGPTRNPLAGKHHILAPEFVMISFIEKDMISHLIVTQETYNLQFLLVYFANIISFYYYSFLVFQTSKSSQSFT